MKKAVLVDKLAEQALAVAVPRRDVDQDVRNAIEDVSPVGRTGFAPGTQMGIAA